MIINKKENSIMFGAKEILSEKLSSLKATLLEEILNEIAMKRVVRKGKIVKKVKTKRKGFKVLRKGGSIRFVRMTPKEKRVRRKAARKAWRVGKSARVNKSKRTFKKSKVRIKSLHRN